VTVVAEIPWTWFAIRASGVTAWGLLSAVVIWGLLLRTRVIPSLAPRSLASMHQWLSALALAFLLGHAALLLVDPVVRFTLVEVLVPGVATWQPLAVSLGILAMWALIPASVLGRWRLIRGPRAGTWFRLAHRVAFLAWPLATAHFVLAGSDAMVDWGVGTIIAATTVLGFLLLVRGLSPSRTPVARRGSPQTA